MKTFFYGFVFLCFVSISCKTSRPELEETTRIGKSIVPVSAKEAMVVSARKEASEIGVSILRQGGTAFDAMIAVEMALAVAYPFAGNLGGGGFMVFRKADGTTGSLDYREKAPLAAYRDMYLDSLGNPISEKSRSGGLAIGVPGTVAGIFAVYDSLATLPMQTLLQPVVDLATQGIRITQKQAQRLQKYRTQITAVSGDSILFANSFATGDTLRNPKLAQTLEQIATEGRSAFYSGIIRDQLVEFIQSHGGIITREDFDQYETKWRKPIQFSYKDLRIISMAPPSSGGVALAQIMKMIEPYPIHRYGHNSTKSIQVLTEAERRAYADRSYYLGDPDFVSVPVDSLLDKNYLQNRMNTFTFDRATASESLSHGQLSISESTETTHYSIVDAFGNAVSVTTTLNGAYGSKLYCEELGFFLNNEMDDFSSKSGTPNMFGLIGAEANAIAPGKRMLSSMTPTIVEKDHKLWMVVGTPGGSTIITSVLQTLLNVYEHQMNIQEAVEAPRFHHQWLPDQITLEPGAFSAVIKDSLESKGYTLRESESVIIGKVDAILIDSDRNLQGGADPRGDDHAVGY